MAVSVNVEFNEELGNSRAVTGSITFDNSYPTGGEAVAITGIERISFLQANGSGYVYGWDKTNQKLLAYRQKDPANAGGADIALPEVGNTTDLSAVTVVFYAVGQ